MSIMRYILLFLTLSSSLAFGQLSLSAIKSAGINSEEDLKSLGVSQSEIDALKKEYFESQNKDIPHVVSEKKEIDNKDEVKEPNNEKKVVVESKKKNEIEYEIYGQSIFTSGSVSIQENSDRIIPSSNYTLGSGDKVSVSIWGISQFSGDYLLDEFGNISPDIVGRINLKGKTFQQAKKIITGRFSQVYKFNSSQIAISLSYSKVISVNVVGEVVSPGTFSIPSINSAFNVLSVSKGPNQNGSVRNIAIVRNGKIINNLDVYNFMNSPSKSASFYLADGDFIIVPPLGKVVSILGEVNRSGKYEIKENETLADLIKFSGGLKPSANQNSIAIISQTENGKVVKSFDLNEANKVKLKNGDEIIISRRSESVSNKITVKGQVYSPGIYEFRKDENLNDFIERVGGFTPQANFEFAHVYRLDEDLNQTILQVPLKGNEKNEFFLKDLDEVLIFDKRSFVDTNHVIVNGLVRNPSKIIFREGMTIKDIFSLSGGAYPQADLSRVEIERINFSAPQSDTVNYVKLISLDYKNNTDFEINPFDIINIRSLPEFRFQESIEVEGEVQYPGVYSLGGDRVKLSDVIKRAGNMTNLAYGEKAYIVRQEDSLGIILLDLNSILKGKESKRDYYLRPGDKVVVPRINNIVSISGAIGAKILGNENKINVGYTKKKRASFYIKKYAGGYDKKANKNKVYVVTLNGQVKKSNFFGLMKPKIEKGDKIIVEYKPEKEKTKGEGINWNDQIENISIKLTGLATLWVLLSQVNF